jgi:hypothetical protein
MTHQIEHDAPPPRRRTWLYVVAGIFGICAMVGISLVVGGVMLFQQHVQTQTMSADVAQAEIDREAERFAGSEPLIELLDHRRIAVHRSPDRPRQPIDTLHLLIYDADDRRLIRLSVPGWLMRMAPQSQRGSIKIDGVEVFDRDRDNPVRLEDLERHGPGVIVNGRGNDDADRFLAWVD